MKQWIILNSYVSGRTEDNKWKHTKEMVFLDSYVAQRSGANQQTYEANDHPGFVCKSIQGNVSETYDEKNYSEFVCLQKVVSGKEKLFCSAAG